jgi:hypothetical protein
MAQEETALDSRAHAAILQGIIERGYAPDVDSLVQTLAAARQDVQSSLERLAADHGVVLHPGTHDVRIAHPFSLSPTHVWVAFAGRGSWAPCLWCAFGISSLVGGNVDILTSFGAEADRARIRVRDSEVVEKELLVHFAIRPEEAWQNVVHFCATVLPFRSEDQVSQWCERHGISRGSVLPISKVNELARHWYGQHLSPHWHKWSVREADGIFRRVGLTGSFWELPDSEGTY